MLIFFTFLVVLSAVAAFGFYVRRRKSNLLEQNPPKNLSAEHFRPLFEPTEDDLRAFEREEKGRTEAKKAEESRRILVEKAEKVSEFENIWRLAPNRKATIELLFLATSAENAEIFSKSAQNILKFWRENRIENLTARDLADLLDSHFRILPQQERTSGALFRLRQEIEELRDAKVRGN